MSVPAIIGRARSWIGSQFGTLTSGQRWTSALAILLAVSMLALGMPTNVRVIAAPPVPPVVRVPVAPPPAPPVAFVPPAPVFQPPAPAPEPEPPAPGPGFTPPPPTLHACATDEMLGAPVFAQAAEQLRPIQAAYEEQTGQPLGVDLVSVALFVGQCTDALPNAPVVVTLSVLLNQIYDALEAAGVPPINLPDPPIVPLPDPPAALVPLLEALAPIVLPACTGVPFFGVTIGVGGALGLAPIADGLLPFPTAEILPYAWPARAVCGMIVAYAPEPEASPAAAPAALNAKPGA